MGKMGKMGKMGRQGGQGGQGVNNLISCSILNKTKKTGFLNEKFRFLPLAILKKPRQSLQRSKLAGGSFPRQTSRLGNHQGRAASLFHAGARSE
jgi:hypothetical protein